MTWGCSEMPFFIHSISNYHSIVSSLQILEQKVRHNYSNTFNRFSVKPTSNALNVSVPYPGFSFYFYYYYYCASSTILSTVIVLSCLFPTHSTRSPHLGFTGFTTIHFPTHPRQRATQTPTNNARTDAQQIDPQILTSSTDQPRP